MRTNELYVHAEDVEIDLAGDMHADFSGFNDQGAIEDGTGLAMTSSVHQGQSNHNVDKLLKKRKYFYK